MVKPRTLKVKGSDIAIITRQEDDFISTTDIARYKNPDEPKDVVKNWMRSKATIEFLGLWEKLHNPGFKGVEFDSFIYQAGSNAFVLSPSKWIETTNQKPVKSNCLRSREVLQSSDKLFFRRYGKMSVARKVLVLTLSLMLLVPALVMAKTGKKAKAAPPAKATVTLENLKKAQYSELYAQAKYQAYAAKAKDEGYLKVARLFRAIAKSEGLQAVTFAKNIKALGHKPATAVGKAKVGTTKDNLLAGINVITYETQATYPDFSKQASVDKNESAAKTFAGARTVKAGINKFLVDAGANLENWKADGDFWVCKVCGNVVEKLDFQTCPVCNAPVSEFEKIK
jgi:rubrerythrin